MAAVDRDALQRLWVRSHEEDTETEEVYRPPDYAFPPARGRTALDLRPDGTYVETAPGPVDVPVEGPAGRWSLEGDRLELGPAGGQEQRTLRVAGVTPDRLAFRKA